MATKKELEQRIAVLEAQVAALLAMRQQPVIINPVYPTTTPWYPTTYPMITCGSDTRNAAVVGAPSTWTIN